MKLRYEEIRNYPCHYLRGKNLCYANRKKMKHQGKTPNQPFVGAIQKCSENICYLVADGAN